MAMLETTHWLDSPGRTARTASGATASASPGGEVTASEADPPTRGPIRPHLLSILSHEISCTCGLRGHVASEDCVVRQRVGHAHVANPALSFDECIEFVLKGSGV